MPSLYSLRQNQLDDQRYHLRVSLKSKTDFTVVKRLIFCSRLLHSVAPDQNGIWRETEVPRVNACIKGFPNSIQWTLDEDNLVIEGLSEKKFEQVKIGESIEGIFGNKENEFSKTEYSFAIENLSSNKEFKYVFDNRSRAMIAFCILWDGKIHPRDEMELNLNSSIDLALLNKKTGKVYGDPSKTVDELRNQGFPRKTDLSPNGVYIKVTRDVKYGTQQEHYQLLCRDQSLDDKVGRSVIKPIYKKNLFNASKNTCNNCNQVFPSEYLAPDHRVPSIVVPDNLSKENYMEKLQTLCVRCNQVKREACKKCPYDHNCQECGWAYPEKFSISAETQKLLIKKASQVGKSLDLYVSDLLDKTE